MKAFITGVTGQDGHYLTDLLNEKGYEVYGLVRRSSQVKKIPDCRIVSGDVTDASIIDTILEIDPDEIYNLAAMSHVGESFKIPQYTFNVNALGTLNLLEAARHTKCKFYQASTSELFGISPSPQNEGTKLHPRSPYGVSKLAAYWMTINYREAYGLETYNGILFNHESPLRGEDFVTQKICRGAAEIFKGRKKTLTLGNIDAYRDWGHAKDYVKGMYLMFHNEPGEYVLATGESHSVREFLDKAFSLLGMDYRDYVRFDPKFMRPSEVPELCGDPSKMESLGWTREYDFDNLVSEMVNACL